MPTLPPQPQLLPCTPQTCPEHQPALGLRSKAGQDLGDPLIQPLFGFCPSCASHPWTFPFPLPSLSQLSHQPLMQDSKSNFAEL